MLAAFAKLVAVVAVPVKFPLNVVAVMTPDTVRALSVPTLVNEELITPLPRVLEVRTSVPLIS